MGRKENKNNQAHERMESKINDINKRLSEHDTKFKKLEKDNLDTRIIAMASMVSSSGSNLHTYKAIAEQTGASESYVGSVARENVGNRK